MIQTVNMDTEQERRKAAIVRAIAALIKQAEDEGWYGEFSVSVKVQNGQIGHWQTSETKTHK